MTYEYTINGSSSASHPTNVGTYTVKITIPEGNNYNTATSTGNFTINPYTPEVTYPTLNPIAQGQQATSVGGTATGIGGYTIAGRFSYDTTTIDYSGTAASYTTTVTVTFKPASNNYAEVSEKVNVTLYAVAYIGSTYYPTINAALAVASNSTIYVVPGLYAQYSISIDVKESISIPNGTSLYIPFEGKNYIVSDYSSLATSFADANSTKVKTNRQTLINLMNGADIIVESSANLYLGGQTRRVGISGLYAEINLDTGSMIDVYGSFYCYGYVKENSKTYKNALNSLYKDKYDNSYDEGRLIRINNGAYLKTIIGIYPAFWDLSSLLNYNNVGVFPFTKFDFPNMQTYTEINNGSTFEAQIFMIGTSSQTNVNVNETMKVVTTSGGMFSLKSGNIAFEYCPSDINYTNNTNITRIYINGELEQGYVDLTIQSEKVTTKDKFIPLSYKFNIFINSGATYSTSYQIKMLPGSFLKVNQGGTLNINSEMIFYDGSAKSLITGYENNNDAILINNGTIKLTANGKLAAFIETECTDGSARLDFSATTNSEAFTVTAPEGETASPITKTSEGLFVDDSEIGASIYQFVAGSIVTSDSNGVCAWTGDKYGLKTITISTVDTGYAINIFSYQIFVADDASGKNSTEVTSGKQNQIGKFTVASGKYVQILIKRHANAVFGDGTLHDSNTWYQISNNMEIVITPNEGLTLTITTIGDSGNGSTSFTVTESSTSNGQYEEIGYFLGITSGTTYVVKGWYFKITTVNGTGTTTLDTDNCTITPNGEKFKVKTAYLMNNNYTVHFPRKSITECLVEGTLITMADGSYKVVDEINAGDLLKVFNHETGLWDIAEVLFNDSEMLRNYTVINLSFSNGSIVKVVSEHGFFDLDLMKYVYIDTYNYKDYIGHRFVATTNVDGIIQQIEVTLDNAYLTEEYVKVYSPVTKYHLNYLTENILSMPGGINGLFNIFEYDSTLKYNEDLMQKDIEEYGLFTYEDFKDLVSEDIYNSFPTQYFKVSIGKGLLTWEELYYYIERYTPLM